MEEIRSDAKTIHVEEEPSKNQVASSPISDEDGTSDPYISLGHSNPKKTESEGGEMKEEEGEINLS